MEKPGFFLEAATTDEDALVQKRVDASEKGEWERGSESLLSEPSRGQKMWKE